MEFPAILVKSRQQRWRWLRRAAGITQAGAIAYLADFGCTVGHNAISRIENDSEAMLGMDAMTCLAYIYNNDGNPANLSWVLTGIGKPYITI